jgi:CRISPR-associated protein Csb2
MDSSVGESLKWLQKLEPPTVIAPPISFGQVVTLFVPNNDADKKPDRQGRLKGKTFRPTLLLGEPKIHYIWEFDPNDASEAKCVCEAARWLTCLGWGIDVAYAEGRVIRDEETAGLSGIRWRPRKDIAQGNGLLRVPVCHAGTKANTFDDLLRVHQAALHRLERDTPLKPVEKLRVFDRVLYESNENIRSRPIVSFAIQRPDGDRYRPFEPARHGRTVAGMMRGTAAMVATDAGWPATKVAAIILGHGEAEKEAHKPVGPQRFAFLPLPSIEGRGPGKPRVVGSIRRVLVTAFADGCEAEIAWAKRALPNQPLVDEKSKEQVALLASLPASDWIVCQYTGNASSWATVTPVVLPGYDDPDHLRRRAKQKSLTADQQQHVLDRLAKRVDGLLRKAIVQAGFSEELAKHAGLDWRAVGFLPGTDLANRYGVPDYLKRFPRLHVRIEWRDSAGKPVQVPGPICIGGGRYFGLGLFVPINAGGQS